MWLLNVTRWPAILLFVMAGATAVALAFITVNLFTRAMANLSLIGEYGWLAVQEGALLQLAGLILWGVLALITYLVFKACEKELLHRYFHWADHTQGATHPRRKSLFRKRDG